MSQILLPNPKSNYFNWLCETVGCKTKPGWNKVLELLHNEDFVSLVPNDDNRVADGIELRDYYFDHDGLSVMVGPCSLLEMIVGLAIRIADILFDPMWEEAPNIHHAFWEMINNLGLYPGSSENKKIVDNLVNRNYEEDGRGGLFPLNLPVEDQRKLEIWYQMMSYLGERYY